MQDCIYYILNFLEPKDLVICFQINHLYHKMAHQNNLWIKFKWYDNLSNQFEHYKNGYMINHFLIQNHIQQPFYTLQKLNLSFKKLTTLPQAIGMLTQLQHLYLTDNQLTTLPPEIGLLTQLQNLYLVYNQLTTLPPEIGLLTQLQNLDLSYNQLKPCRRK